MKEKFEGYLFAKLGAIGTRSEGPLYLLQHWDYSESPVIKKTHRWEEDPRLHPFVGHKVMIEGIQGVDGILYDQIRALDGPVHIDIPPLTLDLDLDTEVLWVNKMLPRPPRQSLGLKLLVNWPTRGFWRGLCPTTQLFDFWIERDGREIWRWSDGKLFALVQTPVRLIGGNRFYPYTGTWTFDPMSIEADGFYTARALFVASGQEVSESFEVKFAEKKVEVGVR